MVKIEIRTATITDAQHIALLGRLTFTETFGHLFKIKNDLLTYYDKTFSVEKIRQSLTQKNNTFWIAFINELPVGYAKLKKHSKCEFLKENQQSQLQKIYVLNDFHTQKIGFHLQEKVVTEAKKHSSIIWLSSLNTNEKANRFYEKLGFHIIGNYTFKIGSLTSNLNAFAKKLN